MGKGSSLAKAGIAPGDELVSWREGDAQGDLRTPFDLQQLFIERVPRGDVQLTYRRAGKTETLTIPPGYLSGYFHPSGVSLTSKDFEGDVAAVKAVAAKSQIDDPTWVLARAAELRFLAQKFSDAVAFYDAAIATATDRIALGFLNDAKARALMRLNDFAKAEAAYRAALQLRESAWPNSLLVALSDQNLAELAMAHRDVKTAEPLLQKALEIRAKRAPDSLDTAKTLNALARAAFYRGDMPVAEDYFKRSLAIQERVAPGGFEHASNLNGNGVAEFSRGDLAAAEEYWRKALVIIEKLVPGGSEDASVLNNLGAVAKERGDLSSAEDFLKRTLAIREKVSPGSLDVAESLNNIGNLDVQRGDQDGAQAALRRSLEIREKLAPESLDTASTLKNLGDLERDRGELAAAEEHYRRSLALAEKIAPGSVDLARALSSMASLQRQRGDLAGAEASETRAVSIEEQRAPNGLDQAASLVNLAGVAAAQSKFGDAEELYRKAIGIQEKLAPGSISLAESLHDLGALRRRQGDRKEAAALFEQALAALEAQTSRLGGTEEQKSGFAARYASYYRDYLELLLELKRPADAFHVLERSRARSLVTMLAERDLIFSADVPPELERERRLADHDYDKAQSELATLNPAKDGARIDELLARERELMAKQQEIAEKIRAISPRLASLRHPQPLTLAETHAMLDPGTLLLAYSAGEKNTIVFALPSGGDAPHLSVFTIPVGEAALREKVEGFRTAISRKQPAEKTRGAELHDLLIKPVQALAAKQQRIVIIPDGPLHLLPFAALVRDGKYLAEWKPIHTVVSATVYAELKKSREQSRGGSLAAFGDPNYGGENGARPLRGGVSLEPLPGTRREVQQIATLYPSAATTYLGPQATERQAKSLGRDVRYIHFASHGIVDERFPLNSALALSTPESGDDDNGLLQAWEIFERMRIDADLVTLSACDTALGKEVAGEGLIGLTRAFQYAGARSILASLWSVADESTAELMRRFYSYLQQGKSKDEALRAAQLDLIRGKTYAQPFHWGAFELIGDWK